MDELVDALGAGAGDGVDALGAGADVDVRYHGLLLLLLLGVLGVGT